MDTIDRAKLIKTLVSSPLWPALVDFIEEDKEILGNSVLKASDDSIETMKQRGKWSYASSLLIRLKAEIEKVPEPGQVGQGQEEEGQL